MTLEKEQAATTVTGEDVSQYLQDIRQFPLLTPQEEKELAVRCAAGDEEAIRRMVNSNLRLVVSVAKGYIGRGAPLLDMIQEGSIGLVTAARKFDPGMENRFSTYATKWIRHGVSRCVMEHAGLIHIPRYTADKIKKLLQAKRQLQQSGKSVDMEELARISGIPAKKAEQLLGLLPEIWSLDAPVGEDDSALGFLLEDARTPEPGEEMIKQELKQILEEMMQKLTPRQQQVLRLRFGMDEGECRSLSEVGSLLGITKERARQIEHEAMDKLKKLGTGFGLEDFLE